MIQPFKTKKETTMTTKFTKHLSPLAELLTFKVQWCGKIIEQDFDNIEFYCSNGKIHLFPHSSDYCGDEPDESIGYYSAPKFVVTKKKTEQINQYFKTKNYPLESCFFSHSPMSELFIKGFRNFSGRNEVVPLESILDDVLSILWSEE